MFIVFDLDGTLFDITHRLHHIQNPLGKNGGKNGTWKPNWDQFYRDCVYDTPIREIVEVCKTFHPVMGHRVEFWSGRSDMVREETLDCLHRVGIGARDWELKLRKVGDHRPDHILKGEWLDVLHPKKPDLVFEDRSRVVKVFRDRGIRVAQVANGEF